MRVKETSYYDEFGGKVLCYTGDVRIINQIRRNAAKTCKELVYDFIGGSMAYLELVKI